MEKPLSILPVLLHFSPKSYPIAEEKKRRYAAAEVLHDLKNPVYRQLHF